MFFYLRRNLPQHGIFNSILKTPQHFLARQAERSFLSRPKSSLTVETPETSSTSRTSAVTREQGMHSMSTVRQPRWKSSLFYTKRTSKSYRSIFLNRLSKRRVPSKMALLAYRLYAPKASQRGRAIMDYSTLESILRGPPPEAGKTSLWNTTSSTWLPLSRTTRCKSLSNKLARKTTNTNAKMRPSTASAIRAYVDRANMASEETVLMRLK